jgi:ribonuclease III
MNSEKRAKLEKKLNFRFTNGAYLEEALRHSSYVNEQPDTSLRNNERMEFLGDAVLNLAIGHILMSRGPNLAEGALSRMRATLVNESRLATISRKLEMGNYIQLGKGEINTHGRQKKSILADTLEAIIAAVYLDGGFENAYRLIESLFSSYIDTAVSRSSDQDFKSRLQEYVQTSRGQIPVYETVRESGPDHDKTFTIRLTVQGVTVESDGKSKKAAEQNAAQKALDILSTSHLRPAYGQR